MKTRFDFRLDEDSKKLVEMAARAMEMTTSSYMNLLVERNKKTIIDDIASVLAQNALCSALIEIGVLDTEDEKKMDSLFRLAFVNKVIEDNDLYKEYLYNFQEKMKVFVKDFVADYIKEKKGKESGTLLVEKK